MCRRPINFLSLAAIIFVAAWHGVTQTDAYAGDDDGSAARVVKGTTLAAKLHAQRASASDLEVGGDLIGLPAGTTRYITREDFAGVAASQLHRDGRQQLRGADESERSAARGFVARPEREVASRDGRRDLR